MLKEIIKQNIPNDVLYEIFKYFITDKQLSYVYSVNKEWYRVIKNRLMITHLTKIIINMKEEKEKLEIDNYLLKKNNNDINILYEDLIESVEIFMNTQ
mgnify:FL=1